MPQGHNLMGWSTLSLTTDADLGALEPQATHKNAPWGQTAWPDQRAEAKRELKIWLERDFSQYASPADRVLDRWAADWVWQYTGSAYTDISTAAADETVDDVVLSTVLATPASDRLLIGADWQFEGVFFRLLDTVNAAASTMSIEYWNGAWTTMTAANWQVADGTSVGGATLNKTGRFTWTVPWDWERREVNSEGSPFYWVRVKVSSALTSGTAASQILTVRPPDGLRRVASLLALHYVMSGKAMDSEAPTVWQTRADVYRKLALDTYNSLRNKSGIPFDADNSGSVSSAERRAVAPARLLRA